MDQPDNTAGAEPHPETETKQYGDGTEATGTAPLPEQSPEAGAAPAAGEAAPATDAPSAADHAEAHPEATEPAAPAAVPDADADSDASQTGIAYDPAATEVPQEGQPVASPEPIFADPSISGDVKQTEQDILSRVENEVEDKVIHPAMEVLTRFEEYVAHLPVALHDGFRNLVNEVRSKL